MRTVTCINQDWKFIREDLEPGQVNTAEGDSISLPHTWNAKDGQDGGNDYYRGACWYVKEIEDMIPDQEEIWLEFGAAAMSADVYVNGTHLAHHEGGYSAFRADATKVWSKKNVIAVRVDNRYVRTIYPQKADFTFYGGIYRDVFLIRLPRTHFSLDHCGGSGFRATPFVTEGEKDAALELEAWVDGAKDGTEVTFTLEGVGSVQAIVKDSYAKATLAVEDVHLWNGKKDPYMYTVHAVFDGGVDQVTERIGFRTFRVDSEEGFFLNGESYPLCGVSRHQDRKDIGNALTKEMHREDMEMIRELGANTLRLAHYQHDTYFYDLCDEAGMIVWAEIPYITEHMEEGRENTRSQMQELIVQNYHHPSIICWGLSNEITTSGGVTDDLLDNHRMLNTLCHQMDPTRLTTMANVFFLETDSELLTIPDIRSYNLYYGWYVGEMEENDVWFDTFHKAHPDLAVGLSEYGADALPCYQSAHPQKGDYTESYQAVYHEHMLKMWSERPYIWAMHVWNMFDFAADGREDGKEPGVNHKGLVTFDRKIKKDAFYIYKAYLSDEPFVHICGRRYIDREEAETEIRVYSNQSEVTLYVDGNEWETQTGEKVFVFRIPITGEHTIRAVSDKYQDQIHIRKTEKPNPEYQKAAEKVVNWFDREDMQVREGYFSIKDSVAEIKEEPQAAALLAQIQEKMTEAYGDVAKNVKIPESVQRQMDAMPLEKMLLQAGNAITEEMVIDLNRELNKIKKKENN